MADYAVIKGASYILVQTPDMVIHNGTTQTTEQVVNPSSEYLVELPKHLRSYEDCLKYIPNQVYIGNLTNDDLRKVEFPYYDKKAENGARFGKYGEIMPEDEFYGLMQICDVFDLVKLEKEFAKDVKAKLLAHGMLKEEQINILDKNDSELATIESLVNDEHAEGLYIDSKLVGCVKRAHDVDVNLSAHTMLENIVTKASSVLSLLHLVKVTGIDPTDVEYVIDCCEEACGDMNQRGGGNFAKATAEVAGLTNATGSDVRGFCAGPSHAILEAASLVKAGTFKTVVVTAGGCTAKLGMNGKDHVKKGLPILEDCLGGFSVLITENDFVSPVIRTDIVGRHTVGTGSAPQNVISSLVTDPLDSVGLKVTDVDKFAPELQNPDITTPAGAGNVPEANYKMIAALAVKRGDIERTAIADFVKDHGLIGWAPTQGHIPSGVPYIGPLREDIMSGKIKRAMIIGKGSLFLGRMTNLFDGVSFVCEKNQGKVEVETETETAKKKPVIGLAVSGTELGEENIRKAIKLAENKGLKVKLIEGEDSHKVMEEMLANNEIQGAVTMHYPFPIGVSTVGRVVTPAYGKEMFIANTTGTSSTDRVSGMVLNTIAGIITAKATGVSNPTIGIANIEGAKQTEMALNKLKEAGYEINFTESSRADGGVSMRGNDLLEGTSDIMVMDSLTGNLMMKIFSSYTTGGSFESLGYGYGPGIGEGFNRVIMIVSRASGAPVIANAIEYATTLIGNDVLKIAKEEYKKANKAGLKEVLASLNKPKAESEVKEVKAPDKEVVTFGILGVEVVDLDDAKLKLWENGIYAETGMGCTGPVILVSDKNADKAKEVLKNNSYIG